MTVPTSILVVTEKVLAFLAIKEREELVGSIPFGKVRKPVEPDDGSEAGRRSLFAKAVDFRMPRPLAGRLKTLEGGTSFHIGFASVGRGGVTRDSKIDRAGGPERRERRKDAAGFEEYVGDSVLASAAVEALGSSAFESYLGLPPQEQRALGGHTRVATVFSNIAADPTERRCFWQGVDDGERRASAPGIALHPDRGSDLWWQQVADQSFGEWAIEEAFRRIIRLRDRGSARSARRRDRKPVRVTCTPDVALRIVRALAGVPGWDAARPAVTIPTPRAGRVQDRWEFEIPHELGAHPDALQRILQGLADCFEAMGVMYTIVLHKPDADNDRRNFHVHVITYNRKCRFIAAAGKWDIAMTATERKKLDVRLENKLRVAAANGAYWEAGSQHAARIRSHFANLCNGELSGISAERHFDPRTYREMGFEQSPQHHMNPTAARLSKFGVATAVETENMYRCVAGALAAINQGEKIRASTRRHLADRVMNLINGLEKAELDPDRCEQLEADWYRYIDLVEGIAGAEMASEKLALFERLARSRAEHVAENCDRMISYVAAGKAKPYVMRHRGDIERRGGEAKAHLDSIDQALLPFEGERKAAELSLRNSIREIERLSAYFHTELDRGLSPDARSVASSAREGAEDRWDSLREMIVRSKPIIVSVGESFDIPSLADSDRVLLASPALAHRIRPFMLDQIRIQDAEVHRLRAAIEAHGLAQIQEGSGKLATARALLDRYRQRPDVTEWLETLQTASIDLSERPEPAQASTVPDTVRIPPGESGDGLPTISQPKSDIPIPEPVSGDLGAARLAKAIEQEIPAAISAPQKMRRKPEPLDPVVVAAIRKQLRGPHSPESDSSEPEIKRPHSPLPESGIDRSASEENPFRPTTHHWDRQEKAQIDPGREQAIRELKDAILNEPSMRVRKSDEGLIIKPLTDDWTLSIAAFSDEPAVKVAMETRAASPWLDLTEEERTDVLDRLATLLKWAERRPIKRVGGRWAAQEIDLDADIVALISSWHGYEPLERVLAEVDRYWIHHEKDWAERENITERGSAADRSQEISRSSRVPDKRSLPSHQGLDDITRLHEAWRRHGLSR